MLYGANILDFRRCEAVLTLPKVMLPHRFQQIKRVSYSTAFECLGEKPLPRFQNPRVTDWRLPDDMTQWPAVCEVLASFQHLVYLRIGIALRCPLATHDHPIDGDLILKLLQPLKLIHATDYEVTVTEPLANVRPRVGKVPFRLVERRIPVRESGKWSKIHDD